MSKENLISNHISRKVEISGVSIPGIINNGDYYIVDLNIYEDGLIYCWEFVDLPLLWEKISKGWIVSSIPDNSKISVFGLGNWQISKGNWIHNNSQLYNQLESYVRRLNPKMENLFDMHGTNITQINGVSIAKIHKFNEKPYYISERHPIIPKRTYGINQNIFYRQCESLYLAKINIFPDGKIIIRNVPDEVSFSYDELEKQFSDQKIITNLSLDQRVEILGLGSFNLISGSGVNESEKIMELKDEFAELRGEETTSIKCLRLWNEFINSPSEQKKEELRIAYEAVPVHIRMFLGDQDSKDYPIRYAIYGDVVKKEWEDRYGFSMPNFD